MMVSFFARYSILKYHNVHIYFCIIFSLHPIYLYFFSIHLLIIVSILSVRFKVALDLLKIPKKYSLRISNHYFE